MKRVIALAALCVVCAGLSGQDKVSRMSVALRPHPDGGFTNYQNFAAYAWQESATVPDRPDGALDAETGKRVLKWPILAYYPAGQYPMIVWYWEGSFRASNGSKWGVPEHWAYVRYAEEVWNPVAKQFEVPGLGVVQPPVTVPPVSDPNKPLPKSLRYGVDSLKIRYTTGDILRAIDESPFNEPSEGAPEEGGSAPL